jgi:carboxyl-terminal processing protease
VALLEKMKSSCKSKGWYIFAWGLGAIMGLVLGCQFLGAYTPSTRIPASAEDKFRLMAEAWNTIQDVYVDRKAIVSRQMTHGAISGMVDSLGDTGHSRFLSPEMVRQEAEQRQGRLEGIGAEVKMKNKQLVIVAPMDDSPAQKGGLKAGEVILKVDGEEISNLPLEEAVAKIQGTPGTRVRLWILNPDTGRSREAILTRAHIQIRNVTWHVLPGQEVTHLRIAGFSKGSTRDLREALKKIRETGATRLILDLRNNPGGLLEEAVETISQFLAEGDAVLEKDAAGKITPSPVKPGGVALDLPLVVLVNGGTASAPEIVAGALQDYRRGQIVGEKTFGTGTVLQRFSLSDGSALMLAINEWLTPAKKTIWHQGISPDVTVGLPPDASPLFPTREMIMTPTEIKGSEDSQLLQAWEMILGSR